jgi:hypothetical protein
MKRFDKKVSSLGLKNAKGQKSERKQIISSYSVSNIKTED